MLSVSMRLSDPSWNDKEESIMKQYFNVMLFSIQKPNILFQVQIKKQTKGRDNILFYLTLLCYLNWFNCYTNIHMKHLFICYFSEWEKKSVWVVWKWLLTLNICTKNEDYRALGGFSVRMKLNWTNHDEWANNVLPYALHLI